MLRLRLVLLLLYFGSICCKGYNFYSQIVLDKDFEDIVTTCERKLCIRKCCGINEYVYFDINRYEHICEKINSSDSTNGTGSDLIFLNLLNVPLYDDYYHDLKVNKNLSDVFLLAPDKFTETNEGNENITFEMEAFVGTDYGFNAYLSESGSLYMEFPNAYERWIPVKKSNYCIDINVEMIPKFWSVLTPSDKQLFGILLVDNNEYHTTGLLISSVFLIIVLLVYMVLPELRNLAGLVLMAYVFSLASAFISLASLRLGENIMERCITWSGVTYFFLLSSFCWTNVMSYDIWWTFRDYAKPHVRSSRGQHFKFGMYCIYAWGVPMFMTIGLMEINKMDLSAVPWIVKPQIPMLGCFLEGGQKFVYLYIPMLILIISNWIFYIVIAFNIWVSVRGSAILNSAHRSQKNRYEQEQNCACETIVYQLRQPENKTFINSYTNAFMIYVKLSVIMGINWSLEVAGYLFPELKIWRYTDVYNLLIGFPIFLIFIWKQKIYRNLKTRFINSPIAHKCYHNSMSSTLEL